MKKHLHQVALILGALVILNSCATSSLSKSERKSVTAISKEPGTSCFVKMNDGSIKNYTTLKLVTGPFKSPYLLADGKVKIKANQITAYQNDKHYAISQATFCCGRKSKVATETLPGFAVRTAKGKLNVYCKKYFNGQVAVDEFFLQAGDDGKVVAYTPELLNELLKDNADAIGFFNNKKFKGTLPEKLLATAKMYNSGPLMTSN